MVSMQGKRFITLVVLIFIMAPLVSGCAVRLGGMTAISTKNVSLNTVDLDKMPQTKNVVGTDSRFVFIFIPLGFPTVQGAVDDALDKGQGDVILDAVLQAESWWFIIGQNSLTVKGNVVNTKGAAK